MYNIIKISCYRYQLVESRQVYVARVPLSPPLTGVRLQSVIAPVP